MCVLALYVGSDPFKELTEKKFSKPEKCYMYHSCLLFVSKSSGVHFTDNQRACYSGITVFGKRP